MAPVNKKRRNQIRIIGGQWRGRRLDFADAQGLRPTPDRVRETLFNWLQPYLPGARCLDLFAGTGALGFEALSRGAGAVSLVEHNQDVCEALQQNLGKLEAKSQARLFRRDAMTYLQSAEERCFDIIFLDPPYGQGLLDKVIGEIVHARCLKSGGWVYMEHETGLDAPALPENWVELKHKRAGQVQYYLLRSETEASTR